MESSLRRPIRLDLVLFKEDRRDQHVAQDNLDLTRMGSLAFLRARETNPKLVPLVQENSPKDAVIFAPHPRSKQTTFEMVEVLRKTMTKLGAPADIFQCVAKPTVS